MANLGKLKDRSPLICPAGLPSKNPFPNASTCLKDYRLQDEVDALKHHAGIFEERKTPFKYRLPILKSRHIGTMTEINPILGPPVKTRYQTLINNLKETAYDSYWNKEDSKCRDSLPGLPAGMVPDETTFGQSTTRGEEAVKVIFPVLKPLEVQWNGQVGHNFYKISHNDYNPAEQRDRNYLQPAFNPKVRYGEKSGYDPRGIWVKCACRWHKNEPEMTVNKIEADVKERLTPQLGRVLAPNKNIQCVQKGHMFGKPSDRPMLGLEELLKDYNCPPCLFKRDFETWMKYLNELRVFIKKMFNKYDFSLRDFENQVMHYDKDYSGWVPLDLFYALCECYGLHYEYTSLEPFFDLCGVIKDGLINYRDYVYLVNINNSVPEIIKIENVPKTSQYYTSSYRASNCDYLIVDNSQLHKAGIPTYRFDLLRTMTPVGGTLADICHLGDETSAGAVINPSIYTTYGLTHRDLFQPRRQDQIKKLFEKIGYEFPEDIFEKLWNIGVKRDGTGLVCVETFKKLLAETVSPSEFLTEQSNPC